MHSGILEHQIDTKLHEALEDADLGVGGSLMDAIVSVDVLHEWFHSRSDQ